MDFLTDFSKTLLSFQDRFTPKLLSICALKTPTLGVNFRYPITGTRVIQLFILFVAADLCARESNVGNKCFALLIILFLIFNSLIFCPGTKKGQKGSRPPWISTSFSALV